jgi:hypothetical protein
MVRFAVRYIAVCERVLGVVFAIYALGGFFFGIFSKEPQRGLHILIGFVALLMMGVPAVVCFMSARAILKGAQRAWFVSLVIGLLIAVIGLGFVFYGLSPQGTEEHARTFGLVTGAILLLPAITGLTLLSFPQTRKFVFRSESKMVS